MKRSLLTWFIVLLLLAAAVVFLLYRQGNRHSNFISQSKNPSVAASQSSASHSVSTNAVKAAAASAKTNRFAWRLANTDKTIAQLQHDPHAILLENAFIDTSAKFNLTIPKNLQSPGDPGAYIVQARGPITPAFKAMLAMNGATVVSYIPNNAYLVRASEAVASGLMANTLVQAVIAYEPYYKVASPLLAMADEPMPQNKQLNLALFPDSAEATMQQIQQLGGLIVAEQNSAAGYPIVRVQPPANWTAVADLPGVHIVEPYLHRHLENDLARPMLGVAVDSITQSNYFNLYGSNVLVEVNDSGIDTNHPDFSNGGGTLRVFYNNPAEGIDTDGHGTHVAGIIAGDGFESTTVTNASGSVMPGTNGQFRGKAPLAKMFAMNFQDDDPTLQQTAATNGALISNNSWDFSGDFTYDLEAASYDAATRDALPFVTGSQPVLFVFSAGNDGGGGIPDTIDSPATAKDVMTVGAIQELRSITNLVTNADLTVSQPWLGETIDSNAVPGFSSIGNVDVGVEGTFGRFKPDVVAPGTFVVSCRSEQWDTTNYYNPIVDEISEFPDFIPPDSLSVAPFNFFVPSNCFNVIFETVTNIGSPPVLPGLPIYLSQNNSPYSFIGSNFVQMPPGTAINENWSVEVSNTTTIPLSYTLIVDVQTTNNSGNYFEVLSNLNQNLGDQSQPHQWYRYETGTSMAAAAMSGFLALVQDYFANQFYQPFTPSPALLKAVTINGARSSPEYNLQVQNSTGNFQGWGLPALGNSVPLALTNKPLSGDLNDPGPFSCSTFFRDQSVSNALATGDSETFKIQLNTNDFANFLPIRVTVAWTDPPGDPSAGLKLVNGLELVVTDLDNPGVVYYGNDIGAEAVFNTPESATNAPIIDNINNIQNVFIQPFGTNATPDSDYSVTILGNRVNVNAVSQHTNNDVQDYAIVISAGDAGDVTDALEVTDEGIVSNPTGDQNISIGLTNTILLNQIAGANTPLINTNTVSLNQNIYGIGTNNSQFEVGMTNQWHFYIVTNQTTFTNAAFITFGAATLSIPRMGVEANSQQNATVPGPDLDLLVTRSSSDADAAHLFDLWTEEISNCVGNLSGDGASLAAGGTDFVVFTNAQPNEIFYVGVKSESHMAVEYGFVPIFSQNPFGSMDTNGNVTINGLNVPQPIPDGTPSHPGVSRVFMVNINPIQIENVVVTNVILHQNFGDLVGSITHDNKSVVLNNHDSLTTPAPPGPYTLWYDDSGSGLYPGSRPSDGPGNLRDYAGGDGEGVWIETQEGTALAQTGEVLSVTTFIQKHQDLKNGITAVVEPGTWFYDFVDVPPGITNLQVFGTNLNQSVTPPTTTALQMFLLDGAPPTFTDFDFEELLTNGIPPGGVISDGPPLAPGMYWVGVFNPGVVPQTVFLLAVLNGPTLVNQPLFFSSTNASPITIDAVTNTSVVVSNTNVISSINVGLVVQYPRISDLAFTLVSPSGQRILLMENRGGPFATNAGGVFLVTNSIGNVSASGSFEANTNYINVGANQGSLTISYNMFTIPDEMTIYYGTNSSTFVPTNLPNSTQLFDSGMVSGSSNVTVNFGPGASTYLTIIMNQFGNTNSGGADAWTYSINGTIPVFNYLTFTEDTNLTTVPIKFAIPPFDLRDEGTNYTLSDLNLATNGDYFGQTNIYDAFGGWTVPSNQVTEVISNSIVVTNANYNEVSVVSDPGVAFAGSNFLALGYGTIVRTNLVTPSRMVTFSYAYRGPGISGWWRGEGDARDSSDAESKGQNGSLIGRFDFPAGEVSQAFEMENNGGAYDFAGTNAYVQIRQQPVYSEVSTNAGSDSSGVVTVQSSYLDVGTGPGFTVEGWINPTNLSWQEPLVEWLARVPTNGSDTNLSIIAGPFLNRQTDHYYYLLAPTNWTTSETWATQLGGHLATVRTANEESWIFDTFGDYHGKNRDLWIGLTNLNLGNYGYSSGDTNVAYTNWMDLQPTNCDGTRNYTLIFSPTNYLYSPTNSYPGLWALANNAGFVCGSPTVTNIVYGVVEVTNLQPNGLQFWISITNVPGTTNLIMTNTGCLFANLVDITNGSHWIYSAPGLVQSNVFQHVALTYDTNSGIANLFYNGTNVASTNFGVVIIPKTTGDVLLGKDMSLETNNYYGGDMDEMSIYSRALSDAEIQAIYHVSAYTTNRLAGKFDSSITPPESLAEAQVMLGGMTNLILGANTTWQEGSFSFTTESNTLPMQITGTEPGILLDDFTFSEAPLGNLYYLPEQSLDDLKGETANGTWTLEIWNTRNNTLATNAQILSWQMQMVLITNTLPPVMLGDQEPTAITVPPGQTVSLAIDAPTWATEATNTLISSTLPLNVFFNQTTPMTGATPPDIFMYSGTSGSEALTSSPIISGPTNFIPGRTYYIGLQNPGTTAASAVFEVDFNIVGLTNDVPFNDTLTNGQFRYFSFVVSTNNPYEATFQLLRLTGNADLVVSKGSPLPTLTESDYGSFNSGRASENIYVLTNSSPVPLTPGLWYLGVFNRDSTPVNYSVLAQELDIVPGQVTQTNITIVPLTNGVPFDYTAGPGAALTNFFSFFVTNTVTISNGVPVTNFPGSIHFELYNMTGHGDLTVQTNAPPFAPPFFQSSQQPGLLPEFIQIQTNSALTNLTATWYLGVPNKTTNLINFTILAVIDTNNVFPAFPGAEGAGAGTAGASFRNGFGTNNTVYHVVNLNDSGAGSLRDAVSSTNRTIVFDVSGTIFLQTPLLITNSYLTIEGQTAPYGGISVASQMTAVQSAHDVVVRDVRFWSDVPAISMTNGFESAVRGDFTNGQTVAGWKVLTNEVSIFTDPPNAYAGSNFLALADGVISNTLPTLPGRKYIFSFAYRGPGIVSMWLAGGNAKDCIGTNNGSISNTVAFVPGMAGQAFNLGTDGFILVPPSPSLNVGTGPGLTMEAWVEQSVVTNQPEPVFQYSQDSFYSSAELFVGNPASVGNTTNCIFTDLISPAPGASHEGITQPYIIKPGVFQHIAVTYNRATGLETLYYNGQAVTNNNFGSFTAWTSDYLLLGRDINFFDPPYNFHFNGLINRPSIYNRALSDAEMNAIYQNGSAGKYDAGNQFPKNLAEAQFTLGSAQPVALSGANTNWQVDTVTFIATQTGTPVVFKGMEPGMLLAPAPVPAAPPGDSFQLNSVSNVIADHISALWSSNNDLSILSSTNITVQWSIISDSFALTNQPLPNGALVRFGSGPVSLHHNLFADNYTGSPRLGDNIALDFVNNVVYDWVTNAGYATNDSANNPNGYTNYLNYICNYVIASSNTVKTNIAFWSGTTNTWVFQTNNLIDCDNNGVLNGANTMWNMFTNWPGYAGLRTQTNQFRLPPVSVDEAYLAYEKILDFAGVNMFRRDFIDTNIVENVRRQTGSIVSSAGSLPTNSSTLIYLNTSQDGIPDFWKTTFGQAVTNSYNNFALDNSGYSELEEFDNWLAGPHALAVTNTPVGINLQKLFGKTGNLSFWLTNSVHGTVYLTNVLGAYTNQGQFSNSIAIFNPTNDAVSGTNYSGFASFDVYVTNNDTVAYFGPVTVSVFVSAFEPTYSQFVGILLPDPVTNNIGGNTIQWYQINVPTNAVAATNTLLFSGAPLNVWYCTNNPPFVLSPSAVELLTDVTNGVAILYTNSTPHLVPGGTYYLGVQNTNNVSTTYAVGLDFDLIGTTPLNGGSPQTNTVPPNSAQYYAVTVPPNAIAATNILLFATGGSIDLWFNQTTLPTFGGAGDTELLTAFTGTTPGIGNPILVTNGVPPLVPGSTYYLAVNNTGGSSVNYAIEVDFEFSYTPPVLPTIPTNLFAVAGTTFTVTDTATDTNSGTLYYFLTTQPPIGATIDTNGIITWNVPTNEPATNILFTTIVTNSFTAQSATNSFTVTVIPESSTGPQTNTVATNSINWIVVNVPTNAVWATNILLYATNLPVNVLFTTNFPPSTNGAYTLMFDETNGTSILGLNTVPTNIIPGGTYYLGVQNTNSVPVNYAIEVDFALDYIFGPPFSQTLPATLVTGKKAQLNGFATPAATLATAWFEYGPNASYSFSTAQQALSSSNGVLLVTNFVSGLLTNQVYHYRLDVSNTLGVAHGADQVFGVGGVAVWGENLGGVTNVPVGLTNVVAIAAEVENGVALNNQGQVTVWGDDTFGQNDVPAGLNNVSSIAAGDGSYALALQNGIVVGWGDDSGGQLNVPAGLSNVVEIAAGGSHGLALKNDGTVVAWGANGYGQTSVPAGLSNVVSIAAGAANSLALLNNGTVVAWGGGQSNTGIFPNYGQSIVPAGLTNVVGIASYGYTSMALKSDGTVVAWGYNNFGQATVPGGLNNVVTIANGLYHSLAAQENGHAVGWGNNVYGESTVPASLTNIFDIAGGNYFSVAVESPLSINLNITPITGGSPETNTVAANGVVYYSVSVPTNAIAASNLLIFATAPLNVWFDQTNLPQPANPPDFLLLGGAFGGTSNILTGSSTPPLVPGQTYYVAVQNTNNLAVNYVFGVNFDLAAVVGPTNPIFTVNIVHTNIGGTNGFLLSWFAPTNDAFEVQETPSLQPVTWNTFTNVVTYNGPPTTTNGLFTFFDDGTQYPFGPMRFYQVVLLSQSNTIPTGGIKWLAINVPTNAIWATNILSSATAPLNVWFTTNFPPTTNSGNIIITYAANGVSILGTTTAPTNIVPGGTYYIGLDNGPSSVPATYNFQVDFALVQPPPAGLVFNSIVHTNISGTNGFLLSWLAPTNDTFQVQETPSLQPVNWHTFTNIITYSGPLTMTNGLFKFFDDGKQVAFGPMRFYRILLLGGSGSSGTLVLPAQSNYIAAVSQPMVITNAGTDSNPAATITYHLANFPTPATNALISTNGLITWTPGTNDAGGAFKFTTVAQDNSLPVLSATNAFTVFVMPAPPIGRAAVTSTNTTLTWRASTNDLFQVEWTTNLTPVVVWSTFLPTIGSTSGFFSFTDTNKPVAMKFYRLIWLPLP
jgi:subtilisin-like proprotein convertase family protein